MNKLINILTEIDDSIEWEKENGLIDDGLLDSFGVISLISELEDEFAINIEAADMVPENFNSVEAMYKMILRLQGK
ncbi:MAG: phosphopantetheine-binding protein [Lachnospiraceae bacterium]|jgi:phosphopantetheine attachment domain protein